MLQIVENLLAGLIAKGCVSTAVSAPVSMNFDALAASFAGLSVAITWVSVAITTLAIVVTVVVALGGYAWARAITREAKEDARAEANRLISNWLRDEAPRLIRDGQRGIADSGPPFNSPDDAADEIGRAAG